MMAIWCYHNQYYLKVCECEVTLWIKSPTAGKISYVIISKE